MGCADTEVAVLSIDHILGGGNKHRKQLGVGCGTPFYQWLIRSRFPTGYRVLCMSCQFRAKHGVALPNERQQMKPTIGRTVIFHVDPFTDQRFDGNGLTISPEAPATIVHVWSDTYVNLKVLSDGNKDVWVQSVTEGTALGQWSWPERT